MKTIVTGLFVTILALGVNAARASDHDALEIEGAYVLYHANGRQRILSLDRSGNVINASDIEAAYGFTTGIGAWELTGPDTATARIVDFNFDTQNGEPKGPALTVIDFIFGDLVHGKYQTVSGNLSGNQYETGQDPLAPTKEPIRTFGNSFTGKRITAK